VHAAANIVRDARFTRIVQEVAVDHAEREADGGTINWGTRRRMLFLIVSLSFAHFAVGAAIKVA
jgi:hypothetical protein